MDKILATGIQNIPHLSVFDELAEERMAALELEALLVYLIDLVPASALPTLAEQFNAEGIKGFGFAQTEAERREVVKNALELQRFKGTPWAIKEALRRMGLTVDVIQERVFLGTQRNGTVRRNGAVQRQSQGHWTFFRVVFDALANPVISAQQFADAFQIIQEYKNARSHLIDFTVQVRLDAADTINLSEELGFEASLRADLVTLRDGSVQRNGTVQRTGWAEDVVINPVGLYSPFNLGGDALIWLQAEDLTDLATLGGWLDSSPYTRTVTAGEVTAGNKPTLSASTLNGFPVCEIPSPGYFASTPTLSATPTTLSIFMVVEATGGNAALARLSNGAGAAKGMFLNFDPVSRVPTLIMASTATTGNMSTLAPAAPAGWAILHYEFELVSGQTTHKVSVNGGATTSQTFAVGGDYPLDVVNYLFAGAIGASAGAGIACNAAELIVSQNNSAALTDKNVGYLAWKFGLVGLLPANHPYKTSQPLA